ncbi:MAG TPA: ABC transporter, partial [Lachnospiraceae bacterium]|nr:ABC transporter [Lachnospiraceae bacterium]
ILELAGQSLTDYIGNYDYYLEKKETMTDFTGSSSPAASAAAPAAEESRAKQNWKQQKELQAKLRKKQNSLKQVEARIDELETRDREIDELLASEEVFTDVQKVTRLSREKE